MPINTNLPQFNGDFPCLTAQYPDSILHQFAFKMTTATGYLTKNQDNFLRTAPFLMSSSGNESYGHAGSYVFDRTKKYWFFEKLQPKTFCDFFFITRFSKNIFRKHIFEKSKCSVFFRIFIENQKNRKSDFWKTNFFDFSRKKIRKFFLKIELWKKCHKLFSAVNFRKINIF